MAKAKLAYKMSWRNLLSIKRLGMDSDQSTKPRSAFERDWDRLVFSWPFRRMHDKTQVFPLASSDYVRTRLTHTLEVASVGRSLGALVGDWLRDEKGEASLDPSALAGATAAACLAHDIGNPPFGHSGESAIQTWFTTSQSGAAIRETLTASESRDFELFEGNAQGFRVISSLEYGGTGLGLTCATLGAFLKYPRPADAADLPDRAFFKKHGYHKAEEQKLRDVAKELGLVPYGEKGVAFSRHPLAYLVEAADDICYRVVDLEDAVISRVVSFDEAKKALLTVLSSVDRAKVRDRISSLQTEKQKLELVRAKAINAAIFSAFASFKKNYDKIIAGSFEFDLISKASIGPAFAALKDLARKRIYPKQTIVSIEVAGYEIIAGLLDAFAGAAHRLGNGTASRRDLLVLNLLNPRMRDILMAPPNNTSYMRLLKITDFVAGMTDSYALDLFRRIRGITVHDGGYV